MPVTHGIGLSYYPRCVSAALRAKSVLTCTLVATSVDVERIFSRGRLLLSHVRNRLTAQTTRALLCVGLWSRLGLVKDKDIQSVVSLPDVDGKEEELDDGWDSITLA
jgi:hypothetical protein